MRSSSSALKPTTSLDMADRTIGRPFFLGRSPRSREPLGALSSPAPTWPTPGGPARLVAVIFGPIGHVSSPRTGPVDDGWGDITATITLDAARFSPEALQGLQQFSHVEVVYVLDRVGADRVQTAARHPRDNLAWFKVGIFAQRAKGRPNRIGLSVCQLVDVYGLTLVVRALDAINGTPVLDIKPYMAELAPRGEVRQPAWSHELMAGYWDNAAPGPPPDELWATRRSYDAVAERYAEQIGGELVAKPLDRALLHAMAELCARGPIADLGCGPGHVGAHLAESVVPVIGIDLSLAMCSLSRRQGAPSAQADIAELPLRSASLAGLVCWYALVHPMPAGEQLRTASSPGCCAPVGAHWWPFTSAPPVPLPAARSS